MRNVNFALSACDGTIFDLNRHNNNNSPDPPGLAVSSRG